MRRVTFDIETEGVFGPMNDLSALGVTVVGVHDSETDEFHCYEQHEFKDMWPTFEHADLLVGFNSDHFDIPILNKYYAGDLTKIPSLDILKEVKNVFGRRLKLDNIAEATLGKKKSGNGLDAVKWWQLGLKEKVKSYCLDDVRITKEVYEYARKHNSLKYRDYDGIREIKLDTSGWEKKSPDSGGLTHTLPF
jgi:DEAD/DEAH box helicase domain-containing protein